MPLVAVLTCASCTSGGGDSGGDDSGGDTSDTDTDIGSDTGTDTDTDTGTDTGDTGGDTDTPNLTLRFNEYLSGTPIRSTEVTLGEQSGVTDRYGEVGFFADAGSLYEASLAPTGFGPVRIFGLVGASSQTDRINVPSEDSTRLLGSLFSLEIDDTKGTLAVLVYDGVPGSALGLEEARVSLDKPYDLALVENTGDLHRFTEGSTTLVGQPATVVFVNVPAGMVRPAVTPPHGVSCVLDPPTITVEAAGFSYVRYYCSVDP